MGNTNFVPLPDRPMDDEEMKRFWREYFDRKSLSWSNLTLEELFPEVSCGDTEKPKDSA